MSSTRPDLDHMVRDRACATGGAYHVRVRIGTTAGGLGLLATAFGQDIAPALGDCLDESFVA